MAVSSEPDLKTLPGRFKFARDKRGLGSRELARLAGVNEAYPSQIEGEIRNAEKIETGTIASLARVLGVSVEWLLEGGAAPDIEPFHKPENDNEPPPSGEHATDPGAR